MLKLFDEDGDKYSTQYHKHRKHVFPILHASNKWSCNADGKKLQGTVKEIYKFLHMMTNIITKPTTKTTTRKAKTMVTKVTARKGMTKVKHSKGK